MEKIRVNLKNVRRFPRLQIIAREEMNPYADDSRANNGGGYSQPHIKFIYGGKKGYFDDISCGEFFSDWELSWNGKEIGIDRYGVAYDNFVKNKAIEEQDCLFLERVGRFINKPLCKILVNRYI